MCWVHEHGERIGVIGGWEKTESAKVSQVNMCWQCKKTNNVNRVTSTVQGVEKNRVTLKWGKQLLFDCCFFANCDQYTHTHTSSEVSTILSKGSYVQTFVSIEETVLRGFFNPLDPKFFQQVALNHCCRCSPDYRDLQRVFLVLKCCATGVPIFFFIANVCHSHVPWVCNQSPPHRQHFNTSWRTLYSSVKSLKISVRFKVVNSYQVFDGESLFKIENRGPLVERQQR